MEVETVKCDSSKSAMKSPSKDNRVRSIFISDLHLGNKFARTEALLEFLTAHRPDYLYLVGDVVDGWCLTRKWHWPDVYNRLFDRFIELAAQGTTIRFTPGNHDEFLRRFLLDTHLVCIRNEFVHCGADGRHFLIFHGDQFDDIEKRAKWLSMAGNVGYEIVLRIDCYVNAILTLVGARRRRFSQMIKIRVKQVVQFISGFQEKVVGHARQAGCDAVVCGHIHMPELTQVGDVLYVNLGDWVENGTALIEYGCGRLELFSTDDDRPLATEQSLPTSQVQTNHRMWDHAVA